MITEDYVSFETAKLLKEKGFNEKCRAFYVLWFDEEVEGPKEDEAENWNIEPKYFSAPTLQMTMKWLRDVHHITIAVIPLSFTLKGSENFICNNWVFNLWEKGNPTVSEFYGNQTAYSTYEEAAEAAIKYCLENLI